MKKCMKLAVTTVVMGCLLSFPAFAAETRAEYKEAVTPIREELKALEEEMDAVRTENKPCRPVSARSGRSVRRPGS